jgi:uncharacterized protein with HEPN domain
MKLNTSPLLIDFLRHIQRELNYTISTVGELNLETVLGDPTLSRAGTHSLLIIGEACKNIPESFRQKYTEFDWRSFAGIQDRLIHHYWGIDESLFWEAISVDVPANKVQIDLIIEQEETTL